jgi:hypothetical protein
MAKRKASPSREQARHRNAGGAMILYHYTIPENLFLISQSGLKPHIHREGKEDDAHYMTMGQPVVWLTRQESNLVTEADIAHYRARGLGESDLREVGDFMFGGPVRLSVNIERYNKRLIQFAKFLRTTDLVAIHRINSEKQVTGLDMLRVFENILTQDSLTQWWLYCGTIPPHKIEIELTAGGALPGIEYQIANHPDEEARTRFKMLRDKVAALPPDEPVSFTETDDVGAGRDPA